MCCIIEATDRHEASRGFCATAGLTVPDLAVYVEVTGPTPTVSRNIRNTFLKHNRVVEDTNLSLQLLLDTFAPSFFDEMMTLNSEL